MITVTKICFLPRDNKWRILKREHTNVAPQTSSLVRANDRLFAIFPTKLVALLLFSFLMYAFIWSSCLIPENSFSSTTISSSYWCTLRYTRERYATMHFASPAIEGKGCLNLYFTELGDKCDIRMELISTETGSMNNMQHLFAKHAVKLQECVDCDYFKCKWCLPRNKYRLIQHLRLNQHKIHKFN